MTIPLMPEDHRVRAVFGHLILAMCLRKAPPPVFRHEGLVRTISAVNAKRTRALLGGSVLRERIRDICEAGTVRDIVVRYSGMQERWYLTMAVAYQSSLLTRISGDENAWKRAWWNAAKVLGERRLLRILRAAEAFKESA